MTVDFLAGSPVVQDDDATSAQQGPAMTFFGCTDWADFLHLLAAGLDTPEPDGLLFASHSAADGQEDAAAAWRTRDAVVWISLRWFPGAAAHATRAERLHVADIEPEAALDRIMNWCGPGVLASHGLAARGADIDPGLASALLGIASGLAAEAGATIGWKVTRTTGEWDDIHTSVVAVYADASVAAAHARAAGLAEEDDRYAEADSDPDDPSTWGAAWTLLRTEVPESLRPYLDGGREDVRRPSRSWKPGEVWAVDLPGRGSVAFSGADAHRVSAAFLCGLPEARPRRAERSEAFECCGIFDVRGIGPAALSYAVEVGSEERGGALATGPDAEALTALVEPTITSCTERLSRLFGSSGR